MTKRSMWIAVCVFWALLWGVLGLVIWPLLFFSFVSLTMVFIPIGVTDEPARTFRHDPQAWNKH